MQLHVCMCKRRREVPGAITHLFYSPNPQLQMDQAWNEVPRSEFKERLSEA
jgi:hypothetical protein